MDILTLFESANISFGDGDIKNATQNYEKIINEVSAKENDALYLTTLQNIAICLKKLGNIDKALFYNEEALILTRKIFKKFPLMKKEIKGEEAKILSNMAVIYKIKGTNFFKTNMYKEAYVNFNNAQECYEKALDVDLELEDYNGVASDLINLGNLYLSQLDSTKAINSYEKSIEYSKKISANKLIGSALCGIGNVHLRFEEYKKATENYNSAISILETTSDYDTQWLIDLTKKNLNIAKDKMK